MKITVPNAKYYGEIIMTSRGMWVTWLKDEEGNTISRLEWTTKKGLLTKLKELGVSGIKKSCIICGNSRIADLELATLYSDNEGNDCVNKEYICKEDKGCNN